MADAKTTAPGVVAKKDAGGRTYYEKDGVRVKADGSAYAKRGEGGTASKRPAYIVYKSIVDGNGQHTGDFEIVNVSRKAEEVLAAVDSDHSLKYKRTEI